MPVRTALGTVIKARRLELGWTQEKLAERISADGELVRQSEISRIENGKIALPRRERLERIAGALDLTLGELLASSGWAGAEPHFQQSSYDPVSLNRPLKEVGDLPAITGQHASRDTEVVNSVRRTLSEMREQPDRPLSDRQVIDDIDQRLLQLIGDTQGAGPEHSTSIVDG